MPLPNGNPYSWELLNAPFFVVFNGRLPQRFVQTKEEADRLVNQEMQGSVREMNHEELDRVFDDIRKPYR